MGSRVLLIDADLRRPTLHRMLGLDPRLGLSTHLTGAALPPEVIQATSIPTLAFMAAGTLPPNAADLLAGHRMAELVKVGLEVFDLIIVDAPPVLGLADAPLLSSVTHATLMVVAADQSNTRVVRSALQRLTLARAFMVGTVLTKFDAHSAGYDIGYGYASGEVRNSERLVAAATSVPISDGRRL
jgi:capsular exopolysaccharide synthesis family protein